MFTQAIDVLIKGSKSDGRYGDKCKEKIEDFSNKVLSRYILTKLDS